MKKTVLLLITIALFLWSCGSETSVPADGYDLVILNGRVMDPETNFDAIRNVGIKNGIIAAITEKEISGEETIDAEGHVVSPGFIDTQTHSHGSFWGVKVSLRDGVTTPMDFEIGVINVDKWYAEREGKWPVNFGTVAAHEYYRMRVLDNMPLTDPLDVWRLGEMRGVSYDENGIPDWADTQADLEQLNAICAGLDEELKVGALGIGSTMGYMQNGVTTFELYQVQKVAANYGRIFASHVRFLGNTKPPNEGTLGALEQLANGIALNQPLLLSHNNNFGWWEVEERLSALREMGYNVWSEYYPYTAGSTTIGSEMLKPGNIQAIGSDYEYMLNPSTGEFMNQEEYERIKAEDPGFMIVLFLPAREEWLKMWLEVPHMTVASDAMPPVDAEGNYLKGDDPYEKFSGHPRTVATHARVLRLSRENNVSLMHTLSQLSYWSAKHVGDAGVESMKVRGRMQEGMVADITIFDPETVTDNADFANGKNGLPSTGIPFVLVNGQIVVKDSKFQEGVYPGIPIRYPREETGRFVKLEKESYLDRILGKDVVDLPDETLDCCFGSAENKHHKHVQ